MVEPNRRFTQVINNDKEDFDKVAEELASVADKMREGQPEDNPDPTDPLLPDTREYGNIVGRVDPRLIQKKFLIGYHRSVRIFKQLQIELNQLGGSYVDFHKALLSTKEQSESPEPEQSETEPQQSESPEPEQSETEPPVENTTINDQQTQITNTQDEQVTLTTLDRKLDSIVDRIGDDTDELTPTSEEESFEDRIALIEEKVNEIHRSICPSPGEIPSSSNETSLSEQVEHIQEDRERREREEQEQREEDERTQEDLRSQEREQEKQQKIEQKKGITAMFKKWGDKLKSHISFATGNSLLTKVKNALMLVLLGMFMFMFWTPIKQVFNSFLDRIRPFINSVKEWMWNNMPGWMKVLYNIVTWISDAITWMHDNIWVPLNKGVKWLIEGLADLLSWVGLNSASDVIKEFNRSWEMPTTSREKVLNAKYEAGKLSEEQLSKQAAEYDKIVGKEKREDPNLGISRSQVWHMIKLREMDAAEEWKSNTNPKYEPHEVVVDGISFGWWHLPTEEFEAILHGNLANEGAVKVPTGLQDIGSNHHADYEADWKKYEQQEVDRAAAERATAKALRSFERGVTATKDDSPRGKLYDPYDYQETEEPSSSEETIYQMPPLDQGKLPSEVMDQTQPESLSQPAPNFMITNQTINATTIHVNSQRDHTS